ncbi:BnaC02g43520D [Brassica napus]|uniref:BnaC02g43520D protein n=1 Tax=Brassica napus TaxID=3708 RepID=A0A078H601_BRANA|nr:BnaC02g43520D [Brassica napus]
MSSGKDRDSENSHRSKKKSILPKVFGSRRSGKEEEDASNNMNNRGNMMIKATTMNISII